MTRSITRRGLAAGASIAIAAALAACGGAADDNEPGDNGGDDTAVDETIVLYSGRNEELIQPLLDQFTADTGIEIEVRYYDTAEAAGLLLEEGDNTPAHLFLAQDAGALGAVSKAGMLSGLDSDLLDRVDPRFRAADGTWVGLTGRSRVLVYNPEAISADELPESVWDLADDAWNDRVAIAPLNGSFQAFVTALRVTDGDEAAAGWLDAMSDAPKREKNGEIVADVASGVLDAGLVNHYYAFGQAAEAGVSIEDFGAQMHFFTGGDPGGLVNISGIGVIGDAGQNANVAAFLDYLLSETAQTYFAEQTYEYPTVIGFDGPAGVPALDELDPPAIDLNDLDDLETTVILIQEAGLA
jgi:iron(III) transport system substrate-binding protein